MRFIAYALINTTTTTPLWWDNHTGKGQIVAGFNKRKASPIANNRPYKTLKQALHDLPNNVELIHIKKSNQFQLKSVEQTVLE